MRGGRRVVWFDTKWRRGGIRVWRLRTRIVGGEGRGGGKRINYEKHEY